MALKLCRRVEAWHGEGEGRGQRKLDRGVALWHVYMKQWLAGGLVCRL